MTVHYSGTGLSDGADLGTPGAGTLTDSDIVFPNGMICKITTGSHESTHQFGNHGLDYKEDMTTNTTDKPYAIDHTVLTTNPDLHCFASLPMGGSAYGGNALVHVGLFGDDTFMTSTREHFYGLYTYMHLIVLDQKWTDDKAAASTFELAVRTATSNIFNSTVGGMNGKIYGIGHSGFDTSQNHAAQLMVMEEIA